jgi:hypothetical protein
MKAGARAGLPKLAANALMIGDKVRVGKACCRALHGKEEIFFEDNAGLAKRFTKPGLPASSVIATAVQVSHP